MKEELVVIRCRSCNSVFGLDVPTDGYNAWRAGTLIQKAMPTLTADERELLISKTCGPCFDKMFATEGDD